MKKALILLFIFALAFSIRLAYLSASQAQIESDEVEYDKLALNLLNKRMYVADMYGAEEGPTSHRPPLYPAFLGLIYMLFGHSLFAARIIQAIISSLTACIIYMTAERIFNRITAVFAGIFACFYMTFVVSARLLYTETLFTFLLALIVYFIVTAERPKIIRFCMLGFLCGIATLLRSAALFLPFIAILSLAVKMRKENIPLKKIATSGLILFICFASVLLPWTIRNYRVHNRFVLVSTNAGMNMYVAVQPAFDRIVGLGPRGTAVAEKAFSISSETERNDFFIKETLKAYREDPIKALKMFALRFLFFWNVIDWEIISGQVINYHFVFIAPFAILGIIFAFRDRKEIFPILLVILYFTSLVLVFQGTPRYRMPIDGYIIMLGSYGIYEFINRYRKKAYPALCAGVYFLFTYLLYKHSLTTKDFIRGLMERIGLW